MRKILLTVAMLAVAVAAGAQNKDQLLSSISKAQAATQNEKKATNPNTWIKYGDVLKNAYVSLFGDARVGWGPNEVMLFNTQAPLSQEEVVKNGTSYVVMHYEFRDLYLNAQTGVLEAVIITKPISEQDLLEDAKAAYLHAAELDVKGSKTKALTDKLLDLRDRFVEQASSYYMTGDMKNAAKYFEGSLSCSENSVVNQIDSMMVYNSALMYGAIGDLEKAKKYYQQCVDLDYGMDGEVYAALAEILKSEGDFDGAKNCLNEAVQKYPSSQSVLVSLINLYIDTKDDPNKILDLIKSAQANEPDNASLVYAEGNVYAGIGNPEKAIECYYKSFEMDPTYAFGIYAVGDTYVIMANSVAEAMDKVDLDDVEGYEKLLAEYESYLLKSVEPFEQAFSATDNQEIKIAAASSLKQIFFRFRDKDPKYKEGYDKYSSYLNEVGAE